MGIIRGLDMAGYSPYPMLGWFQTACLSDPQIIRMGGKENKKKEEKSNTHEMGAKKEEKTETTIRTLKENRVETARNAVSDQRR